MHPLLSANVDSLGFDFGSIEATGVVHDVGGGVGFASEILARKYTNLRLVIQDRPEVCEDGVKVCVNSQGVLVQELILSVGSGGRRYSPKLCQVEGLVSRVCITISTVITYLRLNQILLATPH